MTKLCLLLLCLFTFNAYAQVCSTTIDKRGNITKYIRFQAGKDTVVVGVPYHSFEKLGMTLSISSTKTENYLNFDIRSNSNKLNDSLNINRTSLVFTMTDGEAVRIRSVPTRVYQPPKFKGATSVNMAGYLSDKQLAILYNQNISAISFCIEDGNCIEVPVTHRELRKLKKAISYLIN